jgi:comEA protein
MKMQNKQVAIFFLLLFAFAIVAQPVMAADKININSASQTELTELTGIGDVIAQRIIDYREQQPFKTVEELLEVKGIGEVTLAKIRGQITVTPASG